MQCQVVWVVVGFELCVVMWGKFVVFNGEYVDVIGIQVGVDYVVVGGVEQYYVCVWCFLFGVGVGIGVFEDVGYSVEFVVFVDWQEVVCVIVVD